MVTHPKRAVYQAVHFLIDEEKDAPSGVYGKAQHHEWPTLEVSAEVLKHDNKTSQGAKNDNF